MEPFEMRIEKGLIIESAPMAKILDGLKTWEMRSSATRLRGRIALIQKGSGKIMGLATLNDCIGPLTPSQVQNNEAMHRISAERLCDPRVSKYKFAWVLENARRLSTPISYRHPSGAVIWVNLDVESALQLSSWEA
jgi:hypothetical protein